MRNKPIRFLMALCMLCLMAMISCCAADVSVTGATDSGSTAVPTVQDIGFSDVSLDDWYAGSIVWCKENGIMRGTSDTAFSPVSTLTRAQMATVLYRMTGSPAVSTQPGFTDATADSWYSDAIAWAAETGVMGGYGRGIFGINDPTTREQAVTILWRYAGSPESPDYTSFSDADSISLWARKAIAWAETNGFLIGMTDDGIMMPKAHIKRGEVASLLHHYLTSEDSGETDTSGNNVLVVYFSATGNTRDVAEQTADILGADLYEITPEIPYTSADLAYYTDCRADREQNDDSARPAISGKVQNMADYNVIFIGYPIWHGQPPRIISTFLESYDFTGKTVIPFCTSHSSGYSDRGLKALAPGANWITGQRISIGTSRSTLENWISSLGVS